MTDNPLLAAWTTPFGVPPFASVTPEHFRPAFEAGLAEHRAQIAAITGNGEAASFANTVDAFELAGRLLRRTSLVFYNLTGAETSDALQAIEREIAPVLSRHGSAIYLEDRKSTRLNSSHRP